LIKWLKKQMQISDLKSNYGMLHVSSGDIYRQRNIENNYRINILKIWVNKNDFFRVYLKDYSNPCDDFKSVFSGLKIDDYH